MFREVALSIGLARGLGTGLAFAITYHFGVAFGLVRYELLNLAAFFLVGFFGWSGTDLINNYFDYDIDVKASPERAGLVKRYGRTFLVLGYVIGGLGIGLSWLVLGFPAFIATVLAGIASTLYSSPPLSLKRTVFKPLINLFVTLIPWLIITLSASFHSDFFILSLFFGLSVCALTVGEDIKDYDSDKEVCRTLPLMLGERRLKPLGLLMALFSTMFAVSVWYFLKLDIYYLLLTALVSGTGYALLLRNNPEKREGRMKFGRVFVSTGIVQLIIIIIWVQGVPYL